MTPTASLRADQQPCQNGLLEDHSGGFRIELIRPDGAPIRNRPYEVCPGEVRPGEVRPGEVRPGEVRPGEVRPGEVRPGEVRPSEVRPGEVRPGEVRPWFDRVAVDLHDSHATGRPVAPPEGPDRLGLSAGPMAAGEWRLPPLPQTASS